MEKPLIAVKMQEKDGKLVYKDPKDAELIAAGIKNLRKSQIITVIFDFTADNGKLWHIAHLHGLIGKLSKETGDSSGDVKKEVKKRAGMIMVGGEVKSFKDASKEELDYAIQICIDLGDFINLNLR